MNESSSPAPAPVSPLWTRDFTIITLGSVISMLGNSMSGFALSLLVLDYTGSNLLYAIYIATFTLPQIVMPIFSGAILDRFSRKKTIYTLDFLSSGVYLVAALILSRGWFSFPMLAVFCFIIGSINSIYYVAYDSFYPLLISEGNYSKAYSIASVLETLSALIIPIATYFWHCAAARHQRAVLLHRRDGGDADPRRGTLHRKAACRARARRAAFLGPPAPARHQRGLSLSDE